MTDPGEGHKTKGLAWQKSCGWGLFVDVRERHLSVSISVTEYPRLGTLKKRSLFSGMFWSLEDKGMVSGLAWLCEDILVNSVPLGMST